MKVTSITLYPIKSTSGLNQSISHVTPYGLSHDRHWGLFNASDKIMTGREYPQLLDISCELDNDTCTVYHKGSIIGKIKSDDQIKTGIDIKIHSYDAYGSPVDSKLNQWFSNFIGEPCQLLEVNKGKRRPVLEKHGGQAGDILGFNDQGPILMISKESLDDLNSRLEQPVVMEQFRPNLVIEGVGPYLEDQWNFISIGDVSFRITQLCERCIFTTIDIHTKEKHPQAEPLRTLSKYRNGPKGGVVLGVHAVPINSGNIQVGDEVTVGSRKTRLVTNRKS